MLFKRKNCDETKLEIINSSSSFALKEAYNTVAANILYLPIEANTKKIAVTSAVYGEGKTSVAINLAISLAMNLIDKKILLIDADMRSPRVADFMNLDINALSNKNGLSEFLSEKTDKPNIITTDVNNLDLVFAGTPPFNPAGLIRSDRMSQILLECEGKYDYVIIDTPPTTVVSDAVFLAGRVDGYVITTRAKYSVLSKIDSAERALSSAGASIFGMILTDSKK